VRTGLFLGGKDVNEFVDKAVKEALEKEEGGKGGDAYGEMSGGRGG